jgi:hypothetical protein
MMERILIVMKTSLTILMKKTNMQTICIGALNFDYGDKVVAGFSNIGKVNVDVLHLA